jgi:glutamyl-tRNA reductase
MIVGEPQILGQIKEAYQLSLSNQTTDIILNRLLQRAFSIAKRVRTETGIGDRAVSISYAAIELGRKIFDTLEGKKVLLIGAGEMAEIAVENLLRNKVKRIFVANRTFAHGVALARKFKGNAIRFEEISDHLAQIDVVISSTGASDFVITQPQVKETMQKRRNRPLFFIDIAVPRDIDPHINQLPNAYVYDIDDLKGIIEENLEDRQREAVKAERIVDEAVINFRRWYQGLDITPTLLDLRKKIDAIAQKEADKTLKLLNHLSEKDCGAIRNMIEALTKKILHDPTLFLKHHACEDKKSLVIDITRELFKLDE